MTALSWQYLYRFSQVDCFGYVLTWSRLGLPCPSVSSVLQPVSKFIARIWSLIIRACAPALALEPFACFACSALARALQSVSLPSHFSLPSSLWLPSTACFFSTDRTRSVSRSVLAVHAGKRSSVRPLLGAPEINRPEHHQQLGLQCDLLAHRVRWNRPKVAVEKKLVHRSSHDNVGDGPSPACHESWFTSWVFSSLEVLGAWISFCNWYIRDEGAGLLLKISIFPLGGKGGGYGTTFWGSSRITTTSFSSNFSSSISSSSIIAVIIMQTSFRSPSPPSSHFGTQYFWFARGCNPPGNEFKVVSSRSMKLPLDRCCSSALRWPGPQLFLPLGKRSSRSRCQPQDWVSAQNL